MPETTGINYLRNKLAQKHSRVDLRYKFYEQKTIAPDFQVSTPPQLMWVHSELGWCTKAVDSLADRLLFRSFKDDNFGLNEIFDANSPDIFFDSAITSAMIASCSFVYVSAGSDKSVRLQVIDGGNATGIVDPITRMLTEGYAVLDRNDRGQPTLEAYFLPGETQYFREGEAQPEIVKNNVPYPLLVPIVYRPDDKRPFGHSRISRACMFLQFEAERTMKRAEISAEYYSYPQKYITGLAQDAEIDKWKASMSSMLTLQKDDDGDHPLVGQFQTSSQAPHIDHFKMVASAFAGICGLTLDDLGIASGNPASADAIKSAHENLRLEGRKAQRCFGVGFRNVGIVAACLRDNVAYERNAFNEAQPSWYPMFEPDASSLTGLGDALIKIQQAFPDYLTPDKLEELIGI